VRIPSALGINREGINGSNWRIAPGAAGRSRNIPIWIGQDAVNFSQNASIPLLEFLGHVARVNRGQTIFD
jgi:hypothetical protein